VIQASISSARSCVTGSSAVGSRPTMAGVFKKADAITLHQYGVASPSAVLAV
jgi:hypothetical protein